MGSIPGSSDPEQKRILRLYGALGAALVLSVIPSMIAAFLSLLMFVGVLIAAYVMRTDNEDGSLMENHMTFIIRTIWIGSFFAVVTITIGSIYLLYQVDNTPLNPCINEFLSMSAHTQMGEVQGMMFVFQSCFDNYWQANIQAFITAAIITAGPVLVYFLVRYARGLSRAMAGYRVSNPKSWV